MEDYSFPSEDDSDDHLIEEWHRDQRTRFVRFCERNRPLACAWAIAEYVRIVSATAMCTAPFAVAITFGINEFSQLPRIVIAWQFYLTLFLSWLVPYLFWKIAKAVTDRLLRALRD